MGSDAQRGLGFAYNATNFDPVYGENPPAVGYDLLSCPAGAGGDPAAGRVMYFENVTNQPTGDPGTLEEFNNFLQGRWRDGTPLTVGGNGYNPDSDDVTNFAFTGTPPEFWSELNTDGNGAQNAPGDRRFLMSTGPLTILSGEERSFTFGILWARGDDNLDSVTELRAASDLIRQGFPGCALVSNEESGTPDGFGLMATYPNPFNTRATIDVSFETSGHATVDVFDVLGRRVAVLHDGAMPSGPRSLTWTPASDVPSGVYFVRVRAGDAVATQPVLLQR